jgi:hypothetical protein
VTNGGFPYAAVQEGLRSMNVDAPKEPSSDASRLDRMHELWAGAGLDAIETRAFTVRREFADFDQYWDIIAGGPSAGRLLRAFSTDDRARFVGGLKERLGVTNEHAPFTVSGRANAVKGRVRVRAYRSSRTPISSRRCPAAARSA